MDAPEHRKHTIVQALHAERQPIDARLAKTEKPRRLDGARVCLERDFRVGLERQPSTQLRQEPVDGIG